AFETFVVAFRIDDAALIARAHQALDEACGGSGLAAAGATGNQQAPASGSDVRCRPVAPVPKEQRVTRDHDGAKVVFKDTSDQLLDAGSARAACDQIGAILERVERIGD